MEKAEAISGTVITPVQSLQLSSKELSMTIADDHAERCVGSDESARIWSHSALPGVELFQGTYRDYEFAPHFHTVPALGVVHKGAMRWDASRASHHLPAGNVIMLNPGDVHAAGPVTEHGWSFRVFFLDNALFQTQSEDVGGKLLRFAKPCLKSPRLGQMILELHLALERQSGALEAQSGLLRVFEELSLVQGTIPAEQKNSRSEKSLIRRCKEFIHAHYAQNVSLADLSAAAETSPFHLLRSFRQHVGLTPHAYLVQTRVEAAKHLLRARTAIAEVAAITGFTDQSHLTRHFKRLTGVTPRRFRP